jgi:rhamnosyltransferase
MHAPFISIVIPTKNGAQTIDKCLASIANQTYKNFEVILVDSGSTDNTLTIASSYDFVRILEISPSEFNHGLTRNYAVKNALGELVVMTVQDAYPVDELWLSKLMSHFQDLNVVGVCGQQVVPHDLDKNPHEWFRPQSEPNIRVVHFPDKLKVEVLSPKEFREACSWDNVNAMYRKSILLDFPFPEVSFGEDMAWARSVITAGQKLVYDSNCRVYHYHHSTYNYTYKRAFTVLYFTYKNFKFLRAFDYSISDYLKIIYRNFRFNADLYWIVFNWNKMRATSKAAKDFKKYLAISENALDKYHAKICGVPPQGFQNIKSISNR